jgi:hypothetical protein
MGGFVPELLLWAGWRRVDPISFVGDGIVFLRWQGFEIGVAGQRLH